MMLKTKKILSGALCGLLFSLNAGFAESDSSTDLAKKLQNPVANLISVPVELDVDFGAGPKGDGVQYKLEVEPVVPIHLNDEWNVISRTIISYIYQDDVIGSDRENGLADTLQSFFFSPTEPVAGGWIVGAGPAFLLPTATDDLLGTEKWSAGPTAVALRQHDGWTYGALVNHLWSFAGDSDRSHVNASFFQPFLVYTTPQKTSYSLNTESTYDWRSEEWTVPINAGISQLVVFKGKPIQLKAGARWYADSPRNGPDWGLRFSVTFLFPKN